MQEISAYVSGNKFSATATGRLANHYADEHLEVCVLSNLSVKASKIAHWFRESGNKFMHYMPPETAFILFDKLKNRTFFGTDTFATKPLFYTYFSNKLLIHSNLKDLLVFSESNTLNLSKTFAYFRWDCDDLPADNQTFYEGIFRLLPAQYGIFEDGKLHFESSDVLPEKMPLLAENKTSDAFKRAFENAVSARNTNEITAANLSGGLDSSAVVAVLCSQLNRKLHTVYYNGQTPDAEERVFANKVVEKYTTDHQEVTVPSLLIESLFSITEKIAQPDPGVLPSFIHEAIFDAVKARAAASLFSGHGGDNVTGYGLDFLDDLIQRGQWKKLKAAAKAYDNLRQLDEPMTLTVFKRTIKIAIQNKKWWAASKQALICLLYFRVIPFPKRYLRFNNKETQLTDYKYFEERILKIYPRENSTNSQNFTTLKLPSTFDKNQRNHINFSFIRLAINGNEVLSTLGHQRDVGVSFPFFDRDLLGVAAQASLEQKFGSGYLRGTFREALSDYLPAEVRNRVSKGDFTEVALLYFEILYQDFRISFPLDHALWKIVDARVFQQLIHVIQNEQYSPQQKVKYTWLAMRVINFGVFMEINQSEVSIKYL